MPDSPAIVPVDPSRLSFNIQRDLSVVAAEQKPGPPERVDGLTVGIVTLTHDAPHNGEVHPDGDEILRKGEWHKVRVLEPSQLLHVTPGPNGDHRPR
jgi:hypothetical protein